jgi:hypothetical protein
MCDEDKCGPMHKGMSHRMHHMKGRHPEMMGGNGLHDMKNGMMNKMFLKKVMEQLSDEDKKKILVKKMEMKISMAEQKSELMKEKKKIIAAKFDMKASRAEQKIELLKMVHDMLKE